MPKFRRLFLYPPLLKKERGKRFLREATPLFDSPVFPPLTFKGKILERGFAPLLLYSPFP
jgi:hypothetical protein